MREADYNVNVDVTREEWDPGDYVPPLTRGWKNITRYEGHHTGGPGPVSLSFADKRTWLLSIEAYHEDALGWTDGFYHVVHFADGETWAFRTPLRASQADIPRTLTAHFPGNNPEVTELQYQAALSMARAVVGTREARLDVHSDRDSTICPGDNVRAVFVRLASDVSLPVAPPKPPTVEDIMAAIETGPTAYRDPEGGVTMCIDRAPNGKPRVFVYGTDRPDIPAVTFHGLSWVALHYFASGEWTHSNP